MARTLTERQQKFLDVLFEDAGGDFVQAKKLAGYGDNSSTTSIVEALKDEIAEKTARQWEDQDAHVGEHLSAIRKILDEEEPEYLQ